MNKIKTLSIFLGIVALSGLSADLFPFGGDNSNLMPRTQLSYSNGWRSDRFESNSRSFDGDLLASSSKTVNKNVNVWQTGVQGTFAIPSCYTSCGWDWLSQFYVKGYAYWGTIGEGGRRHYKETTFPDNEILTSTRKTRSGRTTSYQAALGWLLPVTCEFGVAPVVGYSWDEQVLRPVSLVRADPPSSFFALDDANHFRWRGPFVGFNLVYAMNLCGCNDLHFNGGYEYHWSKSTLITSANKLEAAEFGQEFCLPRTFKTRKSNAHGHVGYLDATWDICDCWALKLGGKYRNFRTGFGTAKVNPTLPVDCGTARGKAKWRSWEVTLDIAYLF